MRTSKLSRSFKRPRRVRFTPGRIFSIALLVLFMAVLLDSLIGDRGVFALKRQKAKLQQLQQEVRQLETDSVKLQREIKLLKSDPQTIEKIAREEMKLVKPGEVVIQLPDSSKPSSPPPAPSNSKTPH